MKTVKEGKFNSEVWKLHTKHFLIIKTTGSLQ